MSSADSLRIHLESAAFSVENLHVRRLTGREAVSMLFRFELEISCGTSGVPDGCLPGARVDVVFSTEEHGPVRWIRGVVDEVVDALRTANGRRSFHLVVVPELARLDLVKTQEALVDVSVPDVIALKLGLHGFAAADSELRLDGTYPQRETVVQYGETDLAFVSRLTEHVGVSFFFSSSEASTRVAFTDHPGGFDSAGAIACGDHGERIFALESVARRVPGSVVLQDQNYRAPLVELTALADVAGGAGGGVVDYASNHKTPEEGASLARVRAEALRSAQRSLRGTSGVVKLTAGARVSITEHPILPDPTEVLVVEIEHEGAWPHADEGKGPATYANRFVAVPMTHTHRPPLRTPKPRIHGFLPGIIKTADGAPDGSLPFLDAHGRYLVEFQFDTLRAPDKPVASHRIRMAQPTQGPNHGMHFPLRPGAEVILGFLGGDPDRPVILGAVPNAIAPSPTSAANANHSVLRTADDGVRIELVDLPFDGYFEDAPGPHYGFGGPAPTAPATGSNAPPAMAGGGPAVLKSQ